MSGQRKRKGTGPPDSRCCSKPVLARRITDEEVLRGVDHVKADRRSSGLAELWALWGDEAVEVVPLESVANALPHLDRVALSIKCSLMILKGQVIGCACGVYGQCCRISTQVKH